MKLVRFLDNKTIRYGKLEKDMVIELEEPGEDWCGQQFKETGQQFKWTGIRLLSPCMPSKVICLGLNYRSHAEEMKLVLPDAPILFIKPSTAVIGQGQEIIYPAQSRRVDYEAELAVVIGRLAHEVSRFNALEYVFGYTCANDVTARDKQPADGQWTYAKSFDTFCPLGPVIETALKNPEDFQVKGFLNGRLVQEASTSDHYFSVAEIIEYVSGCMTLLPGDVIMTGTPSGIGPLTPGDKFEVVIEGIGSLSNTIISA